MLLKDIYNITLDEIVYDEMIDEEDNSSNDENHFTEENKQVKAEEDDKFENLILAGFIIGTTIGLMTNNMLWGTVGAFIGIGAGYILRFFTKNK